jgi:hypothetical protein
MLSRSFSESEMRRYSWDSRIDMMLSVFVSPVYHE